MADFATSRLRSCCRVGGFPIRPKHVALSLVIAGCLVFVTPAFAHHNPFAPVKIGSYIERPPKVKIFKRKIVPLAQPTPDQVRRIVAYEMSLWGGPNPLGRIACESGLRWNAVNGQYRGLLQFGPVWQAMWNGTPRLVRYVRERVVKVRSKKVTVYSNGRIHKRPGPLVTQRRITILSGALPADSTPFHGHAAIRVHQRAISGHGLSTGWECPL